MYNYNNNYLWSYIFFNYLSKLGVKYAVVSPGSRNTPINCALEDISNIEKTVILDERQAGYFALGLAKSTNSPVLISTTSGTAVANLYPAIIEAYKSRIPLIICSADRSYEELFTESNQTINQNNLFANHINWFYQFPLPDLSSVGINTLKQIAENTLLQCFYKRKGPVHLNLPFRKPLEPSSYNIFFDSNLLNELLNINKQSLLIDTSNSINIGIISEFLIKSLNGIIVINPNVYTDDFINEINITSEYLNFPIFADASSSMRFYNLKNVINNYEAILRNDDFLTKNSPDIVFIFGRNNTSIKLNDFLNKYTKNIIIIDEELSYNTNSHVHKLFIKANPLEFNKAINLYLSNFNLQKNNTFLVKYIEENSRIENKKTFFLNQSENNEINFILKLFENIPDESNIFIGNSLPIRIINIFTDKNDKKHKIYVNRGASGIDGLIATALGISKNQKNNYLIIGDLSFNYDLTALRIALENKINLNIIILDNKGGGIFNLLPISKEEKYFDKYFKTPINTNYDFVAQLFDSNIYYPTTTEEFVFLLKNNYEKLINLYIISSDSEKLALTLENYYRFVNQ
ncbi:MAG TPA: 2-succinyl-5-enolpyruvyl-6-hydroxy-3-cyclohexene-1-carboxylic-acid synthase [Ignavibacteriales bacterium]|nr:2-succinyl-5-enolpyruvyl-6-hydroxy-3-cyclohexene-1-carboxylic-acid synthase [Ignavibacteriales bacterium]HPP33553.1 2-succinyl-5-enolpyruvyl-6-hydroxy-3-cyclohexene-1-carboxylic-acid synthase [Ignavibacteriales bacterium]